MAFSASRMRAARDFAARSVVLLLAAFALAACTSTLELQDRPPIPTSSSTKYAAIVVDANDNDVLYAKNADDIRYPASLAKMMTIYLMFEAMDSGRMGRSTPVTFSAYAAGRPATKLYLKAGQSIDCDAAIKALVTKSANDVAVAVAEHLGGTEDNFARMMTAKARQLGMRDTVFKNASGLPDSEQRTTARDMARLGMALRAHFPHHYHYFALEEFSFRGKRIRGHNDVLATVPGADGIKTGYTRASGYNLVTSVNRNGKRLVAVVMGENSSARRNRIMEQLVERYMPVASRR